MLVATPSGFADAPVTKRLVVYTAVVPILVGLLEVQYLFDVSFSPHLAVWHQWWRVPLNQLTYVDQVHVLFGLLLFYNLRVVERFIGSRKFLSYIFLIYCGTICVEPVLLAFFSVFPVLNRVDTIPAGQTSVIFALLVLYHHLVPVMYKCQIAPGSSNDVRIEFSDKVLVYAIAAQLCFCYPPGSAVSAFIGWVLGELIHSEIVPGKNWRMPFYSLLRLDPVYQRSTHDSDQDQQDGQAGRNETRPLANQVLDTFRT